VRKGQLRNNLDAMMAQGWRFAGALPDGRIVMEGAV